MLTFFVIYTVLGDYKIQDIFIYIFSQLRQNQKCSVFYLKTAETKSKLLKKKKKLQRKYLSACALLSLAQTLDYCMYTQAVAYASTPLHHHHIR